MYKYVMFLWVFALCENNLFAQNLENAFINIATSNDMMGGSLVVFCENGIVENIAIGKSDNTRNINMTTSTKYRIASISKTITAIAVMQLVEQNLLDLDEDISTILGFSVQNPNHPSAAITTACCCRTPQPLLMAQRTTIFLEPRSITILFPI